MNDAPHTCGLWGCQLWVAVLCAAADHARREAISAMGAWAGGGTRATALTIAAQAAAGA